MRKNDEDVVLVQLSKRVQMPFRVRDLCRLKGFTPQTLVSYPGTDKWAAAFRVLNLRTYEPPMAMATSMNSIMIDVNAAPPAFFDWKATDSPPEWTDRWFKRLFLFNLFLALLGLSMWSYKPSRLHLLEFASK